VINYYYPLVFTKYNTKYKEYNYNHNYNGITISISITISYSISNGLILLLGKLRA